VSARLDAVLPRRARPNGIRERIAVARHRRRVRDDVRKHCLPPLPRHWGAFGRGSFVLPPARVSTPRSIFIGDDVAVHEHMWFSVVEHFPGVVPRVSIGDRTRIGRCCQISVIQELTIDADAVIGDFVQIGDTYHPFEADDRMRALMPGNPVRIGRGAVIGSHVVILPGTTIGAGAYVEHHSVVRGDIEPGSLVAGSPARAVDASRS
jgi:acetyltransferase-like isoleucine patch superfamily enzyme